MATIHQAQRLADIAELMENERYYDLTISCDGQIFKVHRAVMCSASPVIAGACDNDMKESNTGNIEHTVYDADTVKRMVSYVYTQTYTFKPARQSSNLEDGKDSEIEATVPVNVNDQLIAHARVFGIGDYYDIPKLRIMAVENFVESAAAEWEVDGFITVIKEVNGLMGPGHRELRDALRTVTFDHITELTKSDVFMTELAKLEEVQDFSADLLRAVVLHYNEERATLSQQLETAIAEFNVSKNRVVHLNTALISAMERADSGEQSAETNATEAREAIHRLRNMVLQLPVQCRNESCTREFGKPQIEHKGSMTRGLFYNDWWIKCRKCNCKLNQ